MLNFAAFRRTLLALAFATAGVLAPALHVHHHSLASAGAAGDVHCSHEHNHCHHHGHSHAGHDHSDHDHGSADVATTGKHAAEHSHSPASHDDDCAACKLLSIAVTLVAPAAMVADAPLVDCVQLTLTSAPAPAILGPSLARAPPALA